MKLTRVLVYLGLLSTILFCIVLAADNSENRKGSKESKEAVSRGEDDGEEPGSSEPENDGGEDEKGKEEEEDEKKAVADQEEDNGEVGETDGAPTDQSGDTVTAEPILQPTITKYPDATDFVTTFARHCFGIWKILGVILFGRGPFLVNSSPNARFFVPFISTVIMVLPNVKAKYDASDLAYFISRAGIQYVCRLFMFSVFFTSLMQFISMTAGAIIFRKMVSLTVTRGRMSKSPAILDLLIKVGRLGHFVQEKCWAPLVCLVGTIFHSMLEFTIGADEHSGGIFFMFGFFQWILKDIFPQNFRTVFLIMMTSCCTVLVYWVPRYLKGFFTR